MQVLIVNEWAKHGQEPFKAIAKKCGEPLRLQWTISTLVIDAPIERLHKFAKLLKRKGIECSYYGEPDPAINRPGNFWSRLLSMLKYRQN